MTARKAFGPIQSDKVSPQLEMPARADADHLSILYALTVGRVAIGDLNWIYSILIETVIEVFYPAAELLGKLILDAPAGYPATLDVRTLKIASAAKR